MKILRLYAGDDGQSHLEELTLESHPELSQLWPAKGVEIRSVPVGHFMDWHHAPRRQFVIMLDGEMEIGLGDGSVHHFGPGDVLLAEDLTGQGHTRRVTGSQPRLTATVHLAEAG
ncbi:MAG TPA: hypothetical protein VF157_07460 [Chloroflexota bacterium]